MSMQPYQQRAIDEKKELDDRLEKLNSFITSSPIYSGLDAAEKGRLERQRNIMTGYSNVLRERIEAFTEA